MPSILKDILQPLASLRITVVLMAFGMLLIFFGTLAQVEYGIWKTLDEYFYTWVAMVPVRYMMPSRITVPDWLQFPLPGGWTLAPLLLINLLAAHMLRFKIKARGGRLMIGLLALLLSIGMIVAFHASQFPQQLNLISPLVLFGVGAVIYSPMVLAAVLLFHKRCGIIMIHAAIIFLIVGEMIAAVYKVESQMPIYEGQAINWSHNLQESEIAVIDHSDPDADHVVAIPERILRESAKRNEAITHEALPFDIRVDKFYSNAEVHQITPQTPGQPAATHGLGSQIAMRERPEFSGVADDAAKINIPGVICTLFVGNRPIGQYALSPHIMSDNYIFIGQDVEVEGEVYSIYMRFHRYYKPYTFELIEFRHDVYPGTQMPRNFSSDVRIVDPANNVDREVHIKMNHPLRYESETFFQADWIRAQVQGGEDRGTILQVVSNPGAALPYIACTVGGLGLCIHFGLVLNGFLRKKLA